MRRALLALISAVSVLLALSIPASAASNVPLPRSMASTGDSITRAFDATPNGCVLKDCPQYSWSTGTSLLVYSQYRRILSQNRSIGKHAYNDARSGAKMKDLAGQLSTAATQGVQYVTVLMGANDLCTSSVSTMTSTATFTSQFENALTTYFAANPASHVFVSSIPNLYQLWSILHTNYVAQATWSSFGICQSMLSVSNTETQRQQVVAQELADNNALATVCATFTNCRWDNNATYDIAFTPSDVSKVDYFHPSITGQNKLAAVSWGASYWG